MKVLHVITGLEAGGAERSLHNILRHYPDPGHQHVVCSLTGRGEYGPQLEAIGIRVHALKGKFLPTAVPRLVGLEAPDVIQGWMYHANLAVLWGRMLSRNSRTPVAWNIRQSLYDLSQEKPRTALLIKSSALLSSLPSRIIYNSRLAARHHEDIGYCARNALIIPNGFDIRLFRPDAAARANIRRNIGLDDSAVLIGLIARYHPIKDHASFFAAARAVMQRFPESHFLLAGADTDGPEARENVRRNGLQARMHLLGQRNDMPAVTAALDIAVLSSIAEGSPNVVGEAMACAVPCVVTDVGDAAFLVGDTGLVAERRNPQALARALFAMVERADRKTLGQMARHRIETTFSIAAAANLYQKTYETLAAKG